LSWAAKRLELLHELLPTAMVVALLVNPTNPVTKPETRGVRDAASALGLQTANATCRRGSALPAESQKRILKPGPLNAERSRLSAQIKSQQGRNQWISIVEPFCRTLPVWGFCACQRSILARPARQGTSGIRT
jgi:hypothetical protein